MSDLDRLSERLAHLSQPMVIVTAAVDGERAGCLVGFHTQASIDPFRYAVFLSVRNHTYRVATRASRLAVHLLDERDRAVAELFGSETGDDVDKFARTAWHEGPGGVPVLDVGTWFVGEVIERLDAGDHVCHLLALTDATLADDFQQLSLDEVIDLDPGHDP